MRRPEPDVLYFDAAATHRISSRVIDRICSSMRDEPGNASSTVNDPGRTAARAIRQAEADLRRLLEADRFDRVVWTSGATESNYLALHGMALSARPERSHVVISAIEHPSVLEASDALVAEGIEVERVAVEPGGRIDLERLAASVHPTTSVVAVMAVNNETGVIQPLAEIAAVVAETRASLFVDATQAVGRLPPSVFTGQGDAVSLSGHKFGGPKGVGALLLTGPVASSIRPRAPGGPSGLRAGTPNTAGIVGLAEALCEVYEDWPSVEGHLADLGRRLEQGLMAISPEVEANGDRAVAVPSIVSVRFPGIEAVDFCRRSGRLAVSTGSACSTGTTAPSHVLTAMNLHLDAMRSSVRFSFDRFSGQGEVDDAVAEATRVVEQLGGDR